MHLPEKNYLSTLFYVGWVWYVVAMCFFITLVECVCATLKIQLVPMWPKFPHAVPLMFPREVFARGKISCFSNVYVSLTKSYVWLHLFLFVVTLPSFPWLSALLALVVVYILKELLNIYYLLKAKFFSSSSFTKALLERKRYTCQMVSIPNFLTCG